MAAGSAQGFVGTMSAVWRRPGLTALEVVWRWVYGVPALGLVLFEGRSVLRALTAGTMDPARLGLDRALLNDPVGSLSAAPLVAAGKFSAAMGMLWTQGYAQAVWVLPVLFGWWVMVSAVGRTMVLRRADAGLRARVGTVIVLHAGRAVTLFGVLAVWLAGVRWSGRVAITGPIAEGAEPNLIGYCALLIVLTLAMYTGWAFLSWVGTAAPLMAMQRGVGPWASVRMVLGLGRRRAMLMEINLVLAIVRVALIVLAMVFSATPLPFESVTSAGFLAWWWAGVAVLYLLWSDFFHVVRVVGYLNVLRATAVDGAD